jgi:hypothetical protein
MCKHPIYANRNEKGAVYGREEKVLSCWKYIEREYLNPSSFQQPRLTLLRKSSPVRKQFPTPFSSEVVAARADVTER